MDAPLENRDLDTTESGAVSLRALVSALARVPLWLVTWGTLTLLALIVALPWFTWFEQEIGHSYRPGTVSAFLDTIFRTDHASGLDAMNQTTAQSGAILAFVALLAGVFFAGGWLQVVLERTRRQTLRRFLYGGVRYFWRFFRQLILTLLVLALVGWVLYESPFESYVVGAWLDVPEGSRANLSTLDSEGTVFALRATQDVLFAICFALILTWGDYTRTRLALQDTYSALWAGILTFFTMLRHPIRTLRPIVVLLLAEALVIFLVAWIVRWIDEGFLPGEGEEVAGAGRVWLVLILGQLVLMWRHVIRGARYHATVAVSHDIVRPLSRPDPWKESIGGPGGPRYPLEEGDEYGVAM